MRTSSTSQPPKLTPRTEWRVGRQHTYAAWWRRTFLRAVREAGVDGVIAQDALGQQADGEEGQRGDASEHRVGRGGGRRGRGWGERGKGRRWRVYKRRCCDGSAVFALKWGTSPSAEQGRPRWPSQSSEKTCTPPADPGSAHPARGIYRTFRSQLCLLQGHGQLCLYGSERT